MSHKLKRKSTILAFTALALLTTVGVGYAAIPGPNKVIQGCYDNGGNLRVVNALPCPKGHTPLQWNQQGVKGDQGIQGIQGIQGLKGDQGIQGSKGDQGLQGQQGTAGVGSLSAWYVDNVYEEQVGYPNRGTETTVSLDLPAGKYALDGSIFGDSDDGDPQNWSCTLISPAVINSSGGNGASFPSISSGFASNGMLTAFVTGVTTLVAPGTVKIDCNAYNARFTVKLTALTIQ